MVMRHFQMFTLWHPVSHCCIFGKCRYCSRVDGQPTHSSSFAFPLKMSYKWGLTCQPWQHSLSDTLLDSGSSHILKCLKNYVLTTMLECWENPSDASSEISENKAKSIFCFFAIKFDPAFLISIRTALCSWSLIRHIKCPHSKDYRFSFFFLAK